MKTKITIKKDKTKTIIKSSSYSSAPSKAVTREKLQKAGLVAVGVWMLAACANLGFVLGKMPASNQINSYRDSALVEQYRQEQLVDLDELYAEGGIGEEVYNQRKEEIGKQSKAEIADIVYANDADYKGAVKTINALSYCSIAANCVVIASASTYLGLTIKQSKLRKQENEEAREELNELLRKMVEDERARIEELKKSLDEENEID